MKKFLITLIFFTPLLLTAQTNVIITKYPKKVPQGKKWVLSVNKETLIEVSQGVLNSGSMCNARFLSSPRILTGIVEGEYGRPNEVYGILFKDVNKVAYSNRYTYSITPVALVNSDFSLSELRTKAPENVGEKSITFLQGQKVFVGECLNSLQLTELPLSKNDIAKIEAEKERIRLEELRIQKEKEEKELQKRLDWEKKVKESDEYFYSYKLTNKKEIDITIEKEALPIFNTYFEEFKKQYAYGYQDIYETYSDNLRYARSRGNQPEDYALFDLNMYFNKNNELNQITISRVLVKGEGMKEIALSDEYFNQIKKHITINTSPEIVIDKEAFKVNASFGFFFTPFEEHQEYEIAFAKNKKGVLKFYNTSGLEEEEVRTFIKDHKQTNDLEKGQYSFKIKYTDLKLRVTHFQDFGQKEVIIETIKTDEVIDLTKL